MAMTLLKLLTLWACLLLLAGCSEPLNSRQSLVNLPLLPESWLEVYGSPSWSLRWNGPGTGEERLDGVKSTVLIVVQADGTGRILAYPYWPELDIPIGWARPAGAIVAWAEEAGTIRLSWLGGVAAFFHQELAAAGTDKAAQTFNWPDFLDLLRSPAVMAAMADDPWTVDWQTIAVKSVASGFDSRRIRSRPTTELTYTAPADGSWFYDSPFRTAENPGSVKLFSLQASDASASIFNRDGVIRYNCNLIAWFPFS